MRSCSSLFLSTKRLLCLFLCLGTQHWSFLLSSKNTTCLQNSIIPATAAAVSNTQTRIVNSMSAKAEEGVAAGGLDSAHPLPFESAKTPPCTEQQQEGQAATDDTQMRAFRRVLRVVLIVMESCLSLAGFPVPECTPQNACATTNAAGDGNPGDGMASTSLYDAERLAAQHQQWCSCMIVMWRNVLDYLSSGVPSP